LPGVGKGCTAPPPALPPWRGEEIQRWRLFWGDPGGRHAPCAVEHLKGGAGGWEEVGRTNCRLRVAARGGRRWIER
jgi:hypothetical protein